jgi:hypothetical protein
MLVSFTIAPDLWIGDYPQDIQEHYGKMSPRAKKFRPLAGILFFGTILIWSGLSIARLRALSPIEVRFLRYTLSTFIVLMTFNTFDLISADSDNSVVTGGGLYILGFLSLNYTTVADNRGSTSAGGIYNSHIATIKNRIVVGNQASGNPTNTTADCLETDPITYGGYRLSGSGTGCNANGRSDQTIAPADIFVDVLGPLADNGGAATGSGQPTYTHALLPDSPALDTIPAGMSGCSTTVVVDQRGVARPQADSCDVGSIETQTLKMKGLYLPLIQNR